MGQPSGSLIGHSLEWQHAYLTAAPQDSAQRDLVAQLALPIGRTQTREQAQRVAALRQLITGLDPGTAARLYQRLTGPGDALGNLYHLTLHRLTRQSLLSELDARRRDNNRATAPADRGTSNPLTAQPAPQPQPPAGPAPPPFVPQPQPFDMWPHWKKKDDPSGPGSGSGSSSGSSSGSDSSPYEWLWSLLKKVSASRGIGAVLLSQLTAATVAKAVEAAWLVFQLLDDPRQWQSVVGDAGEAAGRAVLEDALGKRAGRVVNLNAVKKAFPVIDLISPQGTDSVKVLGVGSGKAGDALWAQNRSSYTSALMEMIEGSPRVNKAADLLFADKRQLTSAWPSDLTDKTREGIARYIRDKGRLRIPDDHYQKLKPTLADDLARRLKSNRPLLDELGLTTDAKLRAYAKRQVSRLQSLGITSDDLRLMIGVALGDLPDDVTTIWRDKYMKIGIPLKVVL